MPFDIDFVETSHILELWDKDNIDATDSFSKDDLIATLKFTPWSSSRNPFPKIKKLSYKGGIMINISQEYFW